MADEVSTRLVADLYEGARRRGIDGQRLIAGLRITAPQLERHAPRVGWDDFVTFLDRLTEAVGGSWELERLMYEAVVSSPALRVIGGLLISPRQLYVHVCERMARNQYRNLGGRVEVLPDERIRIEVQIPPPYRESLPLMHATVGAFRAFPRLLGQPAALVEADLSPRRSVYFVTPPESQTLPDRALRILGTPLSRAVQAVAGDGPTAGDVLAAIELAFDDSSLHHEARAIGQRLANHTELERFAEELAAVLRERFCCRRVALWWRPASGELRLVRAEGGDGLEAVVKRPLTVADREVGRLEADIPIATNPDAVPLFDALLPWFALGLDACARRAGSPFDRAHAAAAAAESWGLTRRQREVLDLLVCGCTNREIARALGTSSKTVEIHVSQVLRKAGAPNRAALIARLWPGS